MYSVKCSIQCYVGTYSYFYSKSLPGEFTELINLIVPTHDCTHILYARVYTWNICVIHWQFRVIIVACYYYGVRGISDRRLLLSPAFSAYTAAGALCAPVVVRCACEKNDDNI